MTDYSTVMTDHPGWMPTAGQRLARALSLDAGGCGIAVTDGRRLAWCCGKAAASQPSADVIALPSGAGEIPRELADALGELGPVARLRNPSLWDALATAIIRQVIRTSHARKLYQAFCRAYGGAVVCGAVAWWLFPSPEALLELTDQDFADAGLAFKRPALRAAASAFLSDGEKWQELSPAELRTELQRIPRVGPWTAGAAAADWSNDFSVYPCGDLAVRTWAGDAAPSVAWPPGEPEFQRLWLQLAGQYLADLTLLVLAWGDRQCMTFKLVPPP